MDVVEGLEQLVQGYTMADRPLTPGEHAAKFIIGEAIKEIKHSRTNFRQMVVNLKGDFEGITHKSPNIIYVTKQMENNIHLLTPSEVGEETCVNIREHGPRHVFKHILGMEVVWDADDFRVDRIEESEDKKEEEDGSEEE